MNANQKKNCRLIRKNVAQMHALLDEIEKALDPQERHVVSEAIDHTRNFALKHLLADALQFAKADDLPEDHLNEDDYDAWRAAGQPDVAAWLESREAAPAELAMA